MDAHKVDVPKMISAIAKYEKVFVRPYGGMKLNHLEFRRVVWPIIRDNNLRGVYAGLGTQQDWERYRAGDPNWETYTINFLTEVGANRFRTIVENNDEILLDVVSRDRTLGLEKLAPDSIRKIS